MEDIIVIDTGRPKGMVKAHCNACGYTAYVSGKMLKRHSGNSPFSMQRAWMDCGNPDCQACISIPITSIPEDVCFEA